VIFKQDVQVELDWHQDFQNRFTRASTT